MFTGVTEYPLQMLTNLVVFIETTTFGGLQKGKEAETLVDQAAGVRLPRPKPSAAKGFGKRLGEVGRKAEPTTGFRFRGSVFEVSSVPAFHIPLGVKALALIWESTVGASSMFGTCRCLKRRRHRISGSDGVHIYIYMFIYIYMLLPPSKTQVLNLDNCHNHWEKCYF